MNVDCPGVLKLITLYLINTDSSSYYCKFIGLCLEEEWMDGLSIVSVSL